MVSVLPVPGLQPRTEHQGWQEPPASGGIDIPGAEFIMSVGRGVGDEANIEQFAELAEALGATLGCSRPIADNGWLPKARQVGQSGKLAYARVFGKALPDGADFVLPDGERCRAGGLFAVQGAAIRKIASAPIGEVIRGILPFLILLLIVLGIITYVPILTLWLPNAVFG